MTEGASVDGERFFIDRGETRTGRRRHHQRMRDVDYLNAQARKCRMLASGLSNQQDVRTLEKLATEFEERARLATRPASSVSLAA